ncbi:MAG: PAS domain S-box protein [Burkholderiales bacterium]|nr:PAS domain S-box protein [Burkholderiales bacterium]
MTEDLTVGLIGNAALLLSLGLVYDVVFRGKQLPSTVLDEVIAGLVIGGIAVGLMLTPVRWEAGIIFDTRTILLGVTGLFFGAIPTLLAMAIACGYRLYVGGAGALMGIATILSSGMVGLAWRHYRLREPKELPLVEMYVFGIVVHVIMILCMFLLPREVIQRTISSLALPVIGIYPVCVALLGSLLTGSHRRARLNTELRASEQRYSAVATSASDAFVTGDGAGRIVEWNPSAERLFGYARKDVIGQPLTLLMPERFRDLHRAGMRRAQSGGERRVIGKAVELRGQRKDATEFPIELSLSEWTVGEGRYFTGIIRDITERKAAEARIQRLTNLYAALSECNQAIVRAADEEQLFQTICRIAVWFGGMRMAWIGIVDPDTRMVRRVASFGDCADEYLRGVEISVDADSPFGHGPTASAIRTNHAVWLQDFQNEPITAPWHERRARFGFGASATLPLRRKSVAIGVLTLYASEFGAFDEPARKLLEEMAVDISFALDNFAREAERLDADKNLRAAEEQFRGLVEQSIAGIYIIQDGKFAYVNPRFAEIRGYDSIDELIGRDSLSLVAEKDRAMVAENNLRLLAGDSRSLSYNFTALCKDGSTVEVGLHGSRATYRGRSAIIGLLQDISEKKRAEEQIQRHLAQLEIAFMSTVQVATTLGEMRDPYTAGHQRRVAEIAVAIGAELDFDARRQEGLRIAGYLHDIGKITIPAEILSKPGKLSPIEFQLIKNHAEGGYDVLKDVEFPWPVALVALQHHERMDGSGYPQGLKGEAILLEARIMAVADVIEAMSTHRPYRPGLGIDKALAEIERGRGTIYDPAVADACLKVFREGGYLIPG